MSRQTNYTLTINPSIVLNISIYKSTSNSVSLRTGKDGELVRQIKVKTVDGNAPLGIEDIKEIVPYCELESYYCYRNEDGEDTLVKVDKEIFDKIHPKSSDLDIISVVSKSTIGFEMFTGDHYMLSIKSSKTAKDSDQHKFQKDIYNILFYYLKKNNKVMVVKFTSAGRVKFGVIYADVTPGIISKEKHGLRMSVIYHSTYQRNRDYTQLQKFPADKDPTIYGEKLLGEYIDSKKITRTSKILKDDYEEAILEYISKIKSGDDPNKALEKHIKDVTTAKKDLKHDVFAMLDRM